MLGLFIDTVSPRNRTILFSPRKIAGHLFWTPRRDESAKLLPAIRKLLRANRQTFQDLTLLVVVTGPGRFTSTRVAVTVANTLAELLQIPILGIDRLQLLAWQQWIAARSPAQKKNMFPLNISIPTGQGDFFTATYPKLPAAPAIRLAASSRRLSDRSVDEGQQKEDSKSVEKALLAFVSSRKKPAPSQVEPVYVRDPHITKRKKR